MQKHAYILTSIYTHVCAHMYGDTHIPTHTSVCAHMLAHILQKRQSHVHSHTWAHACTQTRAEKDQQMFAELLLGGRRSRAIWSLHGVSARHVGNAWLAHI